MSSGQSAFQPAPVALSNLSSEHASQQPIPFQDFLSQLSDLQAVTTDLGHKITAISVLQGDSLSSTTASNSFSSQIEIKTTEIQLLSQKIRTSIKQLEQDAVNAKAHANDSRKLGALQAQKREFAAQLRRFKSDEQSYRRQLGEQIARQYRILNPGADEAEVREAASADWGNEGVFQTALKSQRGAQSSSVLQSVRSRHQEILKIEETLQQLAEMFVDLQELVAAQDMPVRQVEEDVENTNSGLQKGNEQLKKGVWHARNAKKLKWWTLGVVVLIILIVVAAVLGWCYAMGPCRQSKKESQTKSRRSLSCMT